MKIQTTRMKRFFCNFNRKIYLTILTNWFKRGNFFQQVSSFARLFYHIPYKTIHRINLTQMNVIYIKKKNGKSEMHEILATECKIDIPNACWNWSNARNAYFLHTLKLNILEKILYSTEKKKINWDCNYIWILSAISMKSRIVYKEKYWVTEKMNEKMLHVTLELSGN